MPLPSFGRLVSQTSTYRVSVGVDRLQRGRTFGRRPPRSATDFQPLTELGRLARVGLRDHQLQAGAVTDLGRPSPCDTVGRCTEVVDDADALLGAAEVRPSLVRHRRPGGTRLAVVGVAARPPGAPRRCRPAAGRSPWRRRSSPAGSVGRRRRAGLRGVLWSSVAVPWSLFIAPLTRNWAIAITDSRARTASRIRIRPPRAFGAASARRPAACAGRCRSAAAAACRRTGRVSAAVAVRRPRLAALPVGPARRRRRRVERGRRRRRDDLGGVVDAAVLPGDRDGLVHLVRRLVRAADDPGQRGGQAGGAGDRRLRGAAAGR